MSDGANPVGGPADVYISCHPLKGVITYLLYGKRRDWCHGVLLVSLFPAFRILDLVVKEDEALLTVCGEIRDDLQEMMTRYLYTSGCHVWRMFSAYVYVDLFIGKRPTPYALSSMYSHFGGMLLETCSPDTSCIVEKEH
jgi:hypothetical protein